MCCVVTIHTPVQSNLAEIGLFTPADHQRMFFFRSKAGDLKDWLAGAGDAAFRSQLS